LPNGGNPEEMDVNAPYVGLEWEYVYQVLMGCLVFLIVPGIGLLYGGMTRRKSALAMIFQAFTVMAVCTFQWAFWGFSLAFSRHGGPFIGDLSNFGMINVSGIRPNQKVKETDAISRSWLHRHGDLPLSLTLSSASTN
jgi:Amt family ammonium transporter